MSHIGYMIFDTQLDRQLTRRPGGVATAELIRKRHLSVTEAAFLSML